MQAGETLALILTLFLALYGCAQLIRRLCLWVVRCPRCVTCYRVAVPKSGAAAAPLLRCLQAQQLWAEGWFEDTLVLLPELSEPQLTELAPLLREMSAVTPMTLDELINRFSEEVEKEP